MDIKSNPDFAVSLFDESNDGIFVVDVESWRILDVNPTALRLTGHRKRAELIGKSLPAVVADTQGNVADLPIVLGQTQFFHSQERYVLAHAAHDPIPVSVSASRLHTSEGPVGLVIVRDISERKRYEARLAQAARDWERTFEAVPDPVLILDEQHRIVRANKAAAERLDTTIEQLLGQTCYSCVHGLPAPPSYCPHSRTLQDEKEHCVEAVDTLLRGHFLVTTSPLRDDTGHLQGSVYVARDITEIKRVERALRFTQFSVDRGADAAFWIDSQAQFFYVNDAACHSLGYSRAELLCMRVYDIDPDFPAEVWDDTWRKLKECQSLTLESRHRTKDGRVFPVEIVTNYLELDGKEYNCAFVRDISERKRTERLLAAQRDLALALSRSRSLQETLQISIEAAIETSGMECGGVYLVDQVNGALDLACHSGLSEPFVVASNHYTQDSAHARLVRSGQPTYAQYEDINLPLDEDHQREGLKAIAIVPIRHEASVVGSLNVASRVFEETPEYARTVLETIAGQIGQAVARDQTLERLREREENLRTLFETVDDFMFILDGEGCIQQVNPVVLARLGYAQQEIIGKPVLEVHPPDRRDEVASIIRDMIAGITDSCHVPLVTKSGELIPVETKVTIGQWNAAAAFFGISRDITERKRTEAARLELERQIQQTQKMESLGVLAGGIAHDFNNILMAILGNADMALEDLSQYSPARPHLEDIGAAARQAAELTRQMLAYSGKGQFVVRPVSLSEIVNELANLLRSSVSKNVGLRFSLGAHLPAVEADISQIQQLVMNLVANASESIDEQEEGTVTVRTGVRSCDTALFSGSFVDQDMPPGDHVFLQVCDTGCGMEEETRARIFEPFYTTKFTGRGLGLSAVMGIVRGHKGAILLDTEPGNGTTFTILLPACVTNATVGRTRNDEVTPWQGEGTVLLADDEEAARHVAEKMIERLGFTVLAAADGREALDIFRQRRDEIRVVVLDLTMPRMDGVQTLQEIHSLEPDAKVIICSGYAEAELKAKFAGMRFAGLVQKPFALAKLREVLKKALTVGAIHKPPAGS